MQKNKRPNSRDGESGQKQKQKYYRPSHFNKPKPKTPPKYDRKLDREILQKYAGQFRGSLVGDVASQWLRDLSSPQGGTQ